MWLDRGLDVFFGMVMAVRAVGVEVRLLRGVGRGVYAGWGLDGGGTWERRIAGAEGGVEGFHGIIVGWCLAFGMEGAW
jgi:hypothetical protein